MCDPLTDPTCVVKSIAGGVSNSIFDQLTKWWTDAYSSMTTAFSQAFLHAGDVSISQLQSSPLWRLEVGAGATIAAGLLLWAGARSAWTRSGEAIATGLIGAIKAVFATAMVFVIVTALLGIADGLTQAVINVTAGDSNAFADKVGHLASVEGLSNASGAVVFVLAVLGVVITAVLWAEMLIRAAGIVIVTVSTPVAAAGLVSPRTAGWWRKMVSAELALIFLKPVVALVLAIGFTVSHDSGGIQGALVGFMVLGAAAVAWPVVSRMLVFFEGQFAIGGMAAAWELGRTASAGRFGGSGSDGSQPMWQSMEQASSRPSGPSAGADGPALGVGGGAAEVAISRARSAVDLGSGAAAVDGRDPARSSTTIGRGSGRSGLVDLAAAAAGPTAAAAVAVKGRTGKEDGPGFPSPGVHGEPAGPSGDSWGAAAAQPAEGAVDDAEEGG